MYDARDEILELFKQNEYEEKLKTFYYINTTEVNVEICKSEEAFEKALPLVILSLANSSSIPADITGNARQEICLVDCNIYIPRTKEYDWENLLNETCEKIYKTIWNNQQNVGIFMHCIAMRDLSRLEKNEVERRLIEIEVVKINEKE